MSAAELYMKRCLELAQKAKGHTAPNPMVGAVLVHEGLVIGEGWHKQYGAAHAEVNCLDSVKEGHRHLVPESTMYVSLEPCAHHGHTPPCATRLAAEKVKEVVICNIDPFEKVAGKGIEILKQHSVVVITGVLEKAGLWVNRRFFCFHSLKRPYIILKWAQTKEGYIAPADKSRFQVSNKHSGQLVHKWRTEEQAIMVGTNTALNDDPQLTARLWEGSQPLRLVVDSNLKLPATLKVFDDAAATWIINEKKEKVEGNLHYVQCSFDDTLLQQVLQRLYDTNIQSLIVEGGAALLQSFISADLWDEARVITGNVQIDKGIPAPLIEGGTRAFSSSLADDTLHVYVNKNSTCQYVAGWEL